MKEHLIVLAILFCIPLKVCWSGDSITIDGLFDDWGKVRIAYNDSVGDGKDEDFADLKITNDNDFLYLKFSFYTNEHLLQDFNSIRLYLDTDNNDQSGLPIYGIGAELEWCFGCREGIYHSSTGPMTIRQAGIVFRSAPTVTAKDFELALGLSSDPMTLGNLQIPDTIAIVLESTEAQDLIPDQSGGVLYTIDTNLVEPSSQIPLKREHQGDVRVLTYNTLAGGLLDINRQEHFYRILQALKPDIMAFQEQTRGDQVNTLIQEWFRNREYSAVELGHNNIIVSHYPILNQAVITGSGRTMAVLLETEPILGANLLILNSHLACCTNNESRQHDADEIIMVMREWHAGRGPFTIPEKTPIIHLGDFNLVGFSQQLKTLTEGDIVDEASFGDDFSPDWDDSPLTDLFSRHTAIRMGYTWRNDNETFSPGKLDYILYTDNVIELGNHYILNTLAMSDSVLEKYRLLSEDTNLASDHLPRIMDIASVEPLSIEGKGTKPTEFRLDQNYPNPFNNRTIINYELPITIYVELNIYNLTGQKVANLVSKQKNAGPHQVQWDASSMASGVYYYIIRTNTFHDIKKMILIK